MNISGQCRVEHPRLRLPVYLIVDDGVPLCLRDLITWGNKPPPDLAEYRLAKNVPEGTAGYAEAECFLEEFAGVVQKNGIKGKFTVLPYVPDVGMIDRIPAKSPAMPYIKKFIRTIKKDIMPGFDITPEIITHDRVYDLRKKKLIREKEWRWCDRQSTETLEKYIACSLQVLKNVGLDPNGVTSPVDFGARIEDKYATAVRRAVQSVCHKSFVWYFLSGAKDGFPKIMYFDRLKREAVTSVFYIISDIGLRIKNGDAIGNNANACINPAGRTGYLDKLVDAESPLPLCMHWWLMYSNGRRHGLHILDEIAQRINRLYGDRIVWMKCSDVARYYAVAKLCLISKMSAGHCLRLAVDSPFACHDLTLGLTFAGEIREISIIDEKNRKRFLKRVKNQSVFCSSSWFKNGNQVFLCFNILNRMTIEIKRK